MKPKTIVAMVLGVALLLFGVASFLFWVRVDHDMATYWMREHGGPKEFPVDEPYLYKATWLLQYEPYAEDPYADEYVNGTWTRDFNLDRIRVSWLSAASVLLGICLLTTGSSRWQRFSRTGAVFKWAFGLSALLVGGVVIGSILAWPRETPRWDRKLYIDPNVLEYAVRYGDANPDIVPPYTDLQSQLHTNISPLETWLEMDKRGRLTMYNVPFSKRAAYDFLKAKRDKNPEERIDVVLWVDYRSHQDARENLLAIVNGVQPDSVCYVVHYEQGDRLWQLRLRESWPEQPHRGSDYAISNLLQYCENEDDAWMLTNTTWSTRSFAAEKIITRLGADGLPYASNMLFHGGIEQLMPSDMNERERDLMVQVTKNRLAMEIAGARTPEAENLLKSHFYTELMDDEIGQMGGITQVLHTVRAGPHGGAFEPTERITFEEGSDTCWVRLRLEAGSVTLREFQGENLSFWVPVQYSSSGGLGGQYLTHVYANTDVEVLYQDADLNTTNTVRFATYRLAPPGHIEHLEPIDRSQITNTTVFDATMSGYSVLQVAAIVSNLQEKAGLTWGEAGSPYSMEIVHSPSNAICIVVRYKLPQDKRARKYIEGNIIHHVFQARSEMIHIAAEVLGIERGEITEEQWINAKHIVYGSGIPLVDTRADLHYAELDDIGVRQRDAVLKQQK